MLKARCSCLIYSLVAWLRHCGNSDHNVLAPILKALDQPVPNLLVVLGIIAVNGGDDIIATA